MRFLLLSKLYVSLCSSVIRLLHTFLCFNGSGLPIPSNKPSRSMLFISSLIRFTIFLSSFCQSVYCCHAVGVNTTFIIRIITIFSFLGLETINVSPRKTLSHNALKFSLTSMLFTANMLNTSFLYKKSYVFSYFYYILLLFSCQWILCRKIWKIVTIQKLWHRNKFDDIFFAVRMLWLHRILRKI